MRHDARSSQTIIVGDKRISWDDRWHRIDINGYSMHLSPTQYRICQAFLTHATPSTISGELIILAYRSLRELQLEIEIPSKKLLTKHMSVLNGRLNTHRLHITPFYQGYTLTAFTASLDSGRSIG